MRDVSLFLRAAMNGITKRHPTSLELVLFLLHLHVMCNALHIEDIMQHLNAEYGFQTNLMIDLTGNEHTWEFLEKSLESKVPKILITHLDATTSNLYKLFNMEILSIVRMDVMHLNLTLKLMDELLWRRHYTKIIVDFHGEGAKDANNELPYIFHRFWQQGHTSVLLHWRNATYTYTPYPSIQVHSVANLWDFQKLWQMRNFHQYVFKIPFMEFPPRCFSYRNRKGNLIRTGNFYKIIEGFIEQYNGSMEFEFFDIWNMGLNRDYANEKISNAGFRFIPTQMAHSEMYDSSDALHFGKIYFIVPASKEINQSLYLFVSFNPHMWMMVALLLLILFLFIVVVNYRKYGKGNLVDSLFHAFKIIIFIYDEVFVGKTLFNFMLHLLFLIVGLFLTNSYVCNLSSMYTSRIYEPELKTLNDIRLTKLGIHVFGLDYDQFLSIENMPPVIYERMFVGNDTEFFAYRQKLQLVNIYMGGDDIIDYLFFQQLYMRKPLAKYISEPMYTLVFAITIPHRSPFIEFFNRYLSYQKDNGILNKFKRDSQWDGVISSSLKFFQDPITNRSMSMAYLQYGFVIWIIGMFTGSFAFMFELYYSKRRVNQRV
uniref:Ionotropic receptor n=1 Tax=Stomoxys calcitrans TaxID=35570 RepID=A0A1I8Q3L4_STOCA